LRAFQRCIILPSHTPGSGWLPTFSGLSFPHNLCYKFPNGPCELIFDIYTFIALQWYKEHPNARCFDPCNPTLKFQESRRTTKSPFRECECHLHILPKVGLRQTDIVATLALGSRPKQMLAKVWAKSEVRKSHFMLLRGWKYGRVWELNLHTSKWTHTLRVGVSMESRIFKE
jgi:hypothetical protein